MVDENARTLPLSGLALSIFVVSIVCLFLSVIAVGIRTHVRCSEKTFGWDDILILAGLVGLIAKCVTILSDRQHVV